MEQKVAIVEQRIAHAAAEDHAERGIEKQVFGMALRHRRSGQAQFASQVPICEQNADEVCQRVPFDREKPQIQRDRRKVEIFETQWLGRANRGCRSVNQGVQHRCDGAEGVQARACGRDQ